MTISREQIPIPVLDLIKLIQNNGHEAFIVGGCVRDLGIGRVPKDWDITTNATPEQIIAIAESVNLKTVYENNFGTVAIVFEDEPLSSPVRTIEITPYRTETKYSDHRHPDEVQFAETLAEDLSRRDFTVNAMAYDPVTDNLIDLYKGQVDLSDKVIRAVGNPTERFAEDALRMLRLVRFSAELGFTCDPETRDAATKQASLLEHVSSERIADEFIKIILSDNPKAGIVLAQEIGLLSQFLPEIEEGIGVEQSRSHIYDVWHHNLNALQNAANQGWPLHIRLSALFHDIGKPRTRRFDKNQKIYTFYGHEVVGARMVKEIVRRLKFPRELSNTLVKLVRHHMFFSDPDKITLSAVRRMIQNVGRDNIWDLMLVRRSDRLGMGKKNAAPWRLRKYEVMIEQALRDPISVGMLALNGDMMIAEMGFTPGRRMGYILHALLDEVLDDPTRNTREYLAERARDLNELDDEHLKALGEGGKVKRDELEDAEIAKLHEKHNVRE